MDLLEMVALADQANKLPSMVSGGQQQRAAIARALANDPPLLVADEPTGNLDAKTAGQVFDLFMQLVEEQGKTMLMVTHDQELANRIPRKIEIVNGRIATTAASKSPYRFHKVKQRRRNRNTRQRHFPGIFDRLVPNSLAA